MTDRSVRQKDDTTYHKVKYLHSYMNTLLAKVLWTADMLLKDNILAVKLADCD
jgi:hypothetical protein